MFEVKNGTWFFASNTNALCPFIFGMKGNGNAMLLKSSVLSALPEFAAVEQSVRTGRLPVALMGLSHIHKAHMIYTLCDMTGRKALIVMPNEVEARRMAEDLNSFFGDEQAFFYPYRDFIFRNIEGFSREFEHERLAVLTKASEGQLKAVVCCIDAAMQYTIPPEVLNKNKIHLKGGMDISLNSLTGILTEAGYTRADQVEGAGQFSVRGGILDCYPPHFSSPVRIEFWGDTIESIAYFDVMTQRRFETLKGVAIAPATEVCSFSSEGLAGKIKALSDGIRGNSEAKRYLQEDAERLLSGVGIKALDKYISLIYDKPGTLFDYFADSLLFVSEERRVKERAQSAAWQGNQDIAAMLQSGILCKGLDSFGIDWVDALARFSKIGAVYLDTLPRASYETAVKNVVNLTARQLSPWNGSISVLEEDLRALLAKDYCCLVLCGTERSARIVAQDLQRAGLNAYFSEKPVDIIKGNVIVQPGTLSAGFDYISAKFALITHAPVAKPTKSKKVPRHKKGEAISSLSDLSVGDYVVHVVHGIGIFEGIHKINMQGIVKDYIKIRYAKNDILYVPVTQLDLVSKYIGPREDAVVKLHRLGGSEWQKTRARVKSAVKDIAKELIALYAKRLEIEGHAFPADTEWQREFEDRFQYKETEDQLRCTAEIKKDMEQNVPMDRLLCGDVGFGKTEVALRAAFKCIMDGKQAAFLVPTTILAFQHYQTILSRMEGYPVRIEMLSRFRTPAQQKRILAGLQKGEIDIIVGTHRLIQKDLRFRDLGLLIIDEEQRFGVAQKEKIKEQFKKVDVLTLTATPIPRTLNMALAGIRDMSSIEEAPQDRHPVQTYVLEYDQNIIADAIRRELHRGGQVYYLHNRVESIENTANRISQLVPEARVGIAHGKMSEEELSLVWQRLLENEIDVLVCTTIIETGIDVQNVNTLIIENADNMGLAQLHQIRGRVGRSSRRAFAYLTFMRGKVLSEIATKRLSTISEFTEFGSGMKIAMRDLEIRGAGNVLGSEQHGHMESVGYDMYIRLLNEAISRERGEEPKADKEECLVDIQIDAHIPERYVENLQQRLDIYRRIADVTNMEDAEDVIDELTDRFGKPPKEVLGLIKIALLRNTAAQLGICEVSQKNDVIMLYPKDFDKEFFTKAAAKLRGKVTLNAGRRPYIAFKAGKAESIDTLGNILNELTNL